MKIDFNTIEKTCVENMRGGTGKVYLQKVNPTLANMKMYARITIPQGSSIGVHTHIEDEEIVYCLQGNGILLIDDQENAFNPGDISLTKSSRNHSIINKNKDDLIILAVVNKI